MKNPLKNLIKGSLQVQSEKALGLFSKAIASLKEVNEQALIEQVDLKAKVSYIQTEIKHLESTSSNNTRIINNIEKIFS